MGGIYGHMSHLYEDPSLTFGELKQIITSLSNGKLPAVEKTDGQNIFLSYSTKDNKVKCARNKSDIKMGGLDLATISSRYQNKQNILSALQNAFNSWEGFVSKIPLESKLDIFGPDCNVYFNCEIQDPELANVILYDRRHLVVHRDGHAEFNKETGEPLSTTTNFNVLESFLSKIQDQVVVTKPLLTLNVSNETLTNCLSKINLLQQSNNLLDKDNIGTFIVNRLRQTLSRYKLPDELNSKLIKYVSGEKGIKFKSHNKDLENKARAIAKDKKNLFREAVEPLEGLLHNVSNDLLSSLQSSFVSDQEKEISRINLELSKAVHTIKSSGNQEAIQILNQQLKKLNSAKVCCAAEGIVFHYNNKTYKITGNFAPANQIIGLYKYGRGNKIPPMSQNSVNKVAIIPGSYKPPHVGHYMGVRHFFENHGVSKAYVLISKKSRSDKNNKLEITAEQSKKIWEIFAEGNPNIIPILAESDSPIEETYRLFSLLPAGTEVFLGSGTKDREDTRFKNAQSFCNENNLSLTIESVNTPMNELNIDSTTLREYLVSDRKSEFIKAMPEHISMSNLEKIWETLKEKSNFLEYRDFRSILDEISSKLEEFSGMAAGAVAGSPGKSFLKDEEIEETNNNTSAGISNDFFVGNGEDLYKGLSPEDKKFLQGYLERPGYPVFSEKSKKKYIELWKKKNFKESKNMISRKDFLEEVRLRELIRKGLEFKHKKQESQKKVQEAKLRSYIKLLLEKAEDVPHESTGINVLEDLLKKIMPIIESDYKDLTSNPVQRESFRAHILKAVQNTLSAEKMMDEPPASEEDNIVAETVSEQEDVDINIASSPEEKDKFIDIDGDGKPDNPEDLEKQKQDQFSIPGKDETGRNFAMKTFDQVEDVILNSYSVLSNDRDRTLFYDYLIANIKLYFDKYEDELAANVKEPESKVADTSNSSNI